MRHPSSDNRCTGQTETPAGGLSFLFATAFKLTGIDHNRSLTTLRAKLIKIGAKVVRHAKNVTFQMAEVAVTR